MEKVSIIVPVYNVEKYMRQCLDSIINQDYGNLEIIIIDDGSTDNSGDVCEEYKCKRPDIIVIHQKNKGLSAARNEGTLVATGKYVSYIDSDDWVSYDYVSHQVKLIEKYNADIVAISSVSIWNDEKIPAVAYSQEKVKVYSCKDALEAMMYGYEMQVKAWGKLFRREIIEKYPFPVGALYEDIGMMYKVFSDAKIVVGSNLPLYYYRMRTGSIVNENFDYRHFSLIKHANEQYCFIKNNYPELTSAAGYRCVYSATELAPKVLESNSKKAFGVLQEEVKKYRKYFLFNSKVFLKYKIRAVVILLGFNVSKLETKIEKRLKAKIKKIVQQ